MKLSSLTKQEQVRKLSGHGINMRIGPFVANIQSDISSVVEGISCLYADYPLVDDNGFADFHVQLRRPPNVRRWIHPQAIFKLDNKIPFKPLALDHAYPMFEWGLNWCMAKHGNLFLILHSAVIEKNGHAVVMPAPPGSGKSTLCAALIYHGWRLLSDELTLVSISDGMIVPVPRPVSLKNESIEIIRNYIPEAVIGSSAKDTNKGTVALMKPPGDSIELVDTQATPAWIIFPKYEQGASPRLEKKLKVEAFMQGITNSFNYTLLGVKGFQAATKLIDMCDCYDFTYSNLDEALEIFDALTLPKS